MATKVFDFSEIPIVDTHVHGPMRGASKGELFALDDAWYSQFADRLLPVGESDPRLHSLIQSEVKIQMETRPSATSRFHYIAETHGFKRSNRDELENDIVNTINAEGIKNYSNKIFERERVKWVLVDHSFLTKDPASKMDDFPDGKKKWTYPIAHILQPDWAKERKLESAREVATDAKKILQHAKKNNCSGIKSTQAYFRDFDLSNVSEDEAERALMILKRSKAFAYFENPTRFPVYDKPEAIEALKAYQDFLLKEIFVEAGKLGLVVVIHVAVSVHPALKPWLNDPTKLYSVLDNNDVRRANTKFLLIHTGYPHHHIVSSLISQYPNVYVDLSHYAVDVSRLNTGILSEYLSISSPTKVMHGTDSAHPDIIAFGAHNTRIALAKFAEWLYDIEHWSESEITSLAEQVMYKNADRLFPA
jgi:hypothetical protein